jgi:hypothetical protein
MIPRRASTPGTLDTPPFKNTESLLLLTIPVLDES